MDEDLKNIAPFLEALNRVAHDPENLGKSLNDVDKAFSAALEDAAKTEIEAPPSRFSALKKAMVRALHQPASLDELFHQLPQKCDLTPREIRLLQVIKFFSVDQNNQSVFRPQEGIILKPSKAAIYFFLLGGLTGFAIASILIEPAAGIALILRAAGLGLAIGSVAGFVAARSWRLYPILRKLEGLYPWLSSYSEPFAKA